ncbi:replication initiation protein, partial [Campylobacter upsaliensis]|nr:replication initiation protein [Campylobacter upsaliensis]
MKGHIMACKKLVTFDFVGRSYTLKMTKRSQFGNCNKVSKAKITYRNELNALSFPKFTAMDFNLFFTICYFVIKQNKNKRALKKSVKIKFDDLRIFMPDIKNKKRFFDEIVKFVKYKLKWVGVDTIRYDSEADKDSDVLEYLENGEREVEGSVFLNKYLVSERNEELYLEITPYAYSMLNEFGNFMSFDMSEFCSFENKYTKTLFRLLKQYENLNSYNIDENSNLKAIKMNKNEFMKFMDTPSNYKMSHLDCRVMTPSLDELNSK